MVEVLNVAIPKKGSRPITVNGVEYHWYIRRKPSDAQYFSFYTLTFAVQRTTHEKTSTLIVHTPPRKRPDRWSIGNHSVAVCPSDVAAAIESVLEAGWDPFNGKRPFHHTINVGKSV